MSTEKIALITGANKGIGLETARQLAKQNITVLAGARDEAKANAAAAELRKEGLDVHRIVVDVNDEESIQRAAAPSKTAVRFGTVLDSIDADNLLRVINPVENAPIASS